MKKLISIFAILSILQISQSNCFAQASSPDQITPLLEKSALPYTKLVNIDAEEKKLDEIINGVPTVLIFYRGGWCPYCNLQLGELQKIESKLKSLGVNIVAISPDSPEDLKKLIEKKTLSYQLYSDPNLDTAKAFGIAYKVDNENYKKLKGFSANMKKKSEQPDRILPVPAAFLVDKDGIIRFHYANANYKIRVSSDDLIAQAKALSSN